MEMMVLTLLAMVFGGASCILHVCYNKDVKTERKMNSALFYMLIFFIVAVLLCVVIKVFEKQIVQVVDFIYSNIMGL